MSLLRNGPFSFIFDYFLFHLPIVSTQNIFALRKPPTVEHTAPTGEKTNCLFYCHYLLCLFLLSRKCQSIITDVYFIYFFVFVLFILCVNVLLYVFPWDNGNLCTEIESQRFPVQHAKMQHITAKPQQSFWSLSDAWKQERKKKYSAFYSFLYSHTFFTCTHVAVYSAHAWRHSLHGQPERYRGLCPATILITHSQRCMGDHPLTCERDNALEGRREHHTCGNNGRLKNSATVW